MSDKNLQASVELQVTTPGADKVTQLKKEIAELLTALGAAGATASVSLEKAGEKVATLSAKAQAARDKELSAEQAHARKLELLEKQKEVVQARTEAKRVEQAALADKRIETERERHANKIAALQVKADAALAAAEAKRAALATTADAKIEASRNNLAAVEMQTIARQEAAEQAQHDRRIRRLQAVAAAQLRAGPANDMARLSASTAQDRWVNGGRVINPNTAYDMAVSENAARTLAASQAAALTAANSFGGKFKAAMTGWGASASQSFVSSMQSSMNNGMAGMVAGLGTFFAARKLYKDNVDDATIHYGMQSAYAKDADGGAARGGAAEKRLMSMSNKYGTSYAQTGKESIGFVSAAAASGMSDQDTFDTVEGFSATKAARHLGDGQMNKAMRAVAEMAGKEFVYSKEVKQQLNNDIPGLLTDVEQYLINNSNGLIKNSDDVDKLLRGKMKNEKGQTVRLDSKKFAPEMGRYEKDKNEKAAAEAAETSPMAQVNRFQNALFELNTTFGKSGAAEAFAKAIKQVVSAFQSPEIKNMFANMGVHLKLMADGFAPAIANAAKWAKENTGLIQSTLGVVAKVTGASLAFKVLLGVVGFVLSPVRLVAGAILTLGGGFDGLKNKGATLLTGLQALGSTPTWSTVKTKVADMASSVANGFTSAVGKAKSFGNGVLQLGSDLASSKTRSEAFRTALGQLRASMTNAGTGARDLGSKLSKMLSGALRTINGAVRAAGIAASISAGQDMFSFGRAVDGLKKFDGRDNSKLSDAELDQKLELAAKGEGAVKSNRDGFITGTLQTISDKVLGTTTVKTADEAINTFKQIQREIQAEMSKRDDARLRAQEKPEEKNPLKGDALVVAEGKEKHRSARAQASEEATSLKELANQAYMDRVAHIKEEKAAAEEALKAQLEDALISYEQFYADKAGLVNAAIDDEEKALQDNIKANISAENRKLGAARDQADKNASLNTLKKLELELTQKIATLEAQRGKELQKINTEESKNSKKVEKQFAAMRSKTNKLNGLVDVQDDYDAIDAAHAKDYEEADRADPRGESGYRATVDQSVAAEKRVADMKAYDERQSELTNALAAKEAEIQLQVMQGMMGKAEAEDKILELKKQQALKNIEILQQEAQMANPLSVQAKIQKELVANKQVLATASARQVELEKSIQGAAETALQSVLNGTKGIGGAIKGALSSIVASINKMLTEDIAQSFMKWLKGGNSGGGGILGAFTSMMGFGGTPRGAAQGFEFAGSGTGSAMGGIGSVVSGIASLFMADGGSAEGAVFGPGSGTSDSVPARLSHGEYVFTAKDVDAMGGAKKLDAFRKSLHTMAFAEGGSVTSAALAANSRPGGLASAMTGLGGGGVTMNISTPDANSFRASKSQLLAQYQLAAAIAARRSR